MRYSRMRRTSLARTSPSLNSNNKSAGLNGSALVFRLIGDLLSQAESLDDSTIALHVVLIEVA